MSINWEKVKISDLLKLIIDHRGKTPKKMGFEDFHPHGYPVLSAKHVKTEGLTNLDSLRFANDVLYKKWMKEEVQEGDIILTSEAPLGELYYISKSEKFVLGQRVFGLRPDKKLINPLYFFTWLSSKKGQDSLYGKATGSTVQGIKQSELLKIEVDLPPYEIQNHIAEVHFSLAGKIKKNKEIKQTLEQMAQALFKSWFVDFEPVKAKIAVLESGGSQENATLAAMTAICGKDADALMMFEHEHPEQYAELKATAELFPSAMQDSELGDIPEGWELGKLQDLLVLQRGFDLPASSRTEGYFPLIAASGPSGTHNVAMAKAPGVVTGRSGVLGNVFLTLEDYWPLNTTLWVKEFKRATPCFAYELLRLLDLKAFNAGSAVPSLNRNHIHSLNYPLPPMALVNPFESTALLLHQHAHANAKQSQTLAILRDTLLPKLLSGEMTLPEAEQAVDEVENV